MRSALQDNMSFLRTSPIWFFFKRRFLELWGLAFMALGGFLLAALWSYDPYDPSLNTAIDGPIHNWMGQTGAFASDFLMQSMGASSYFLAIMLICYGLGRFYHNISRALWGRLLGGVIFLGATSALLEISRHNGGVLGFLLKKILSLKGVSPYAILGALCAMACCVTPWAFHFPKGVRKIFSLIHTCFLSLLKMAVFIINRRPKLRLRRSNTSFLSSLSSFLSSFLSVLTFWDSLKKTVAPKTRRQEPVFNQEKDQENKTHDSLSVHAHTIDLSVRETRPPKKEEEHQGVKKKETAKPSFFKQALSKVVTLNDRETYQLPPLDLLTEADHVRVERESDAVLNARALELKGVLDDFSVKGEITKVRPGPVVTLYELVPAPGVKASRIIGLADDIARSMCAISARIAVIPGKNALGIELPNSVRETVVLKELLDCKDFDGSHAKLSLVLGKDIGGSPVVADLARMPHLLVAGTTGSGKSVAINTMILSLLYRLPPEKCRFIMIDPKMLELSVYNDIPHLLSPVVTDPKKAIYALKWTVREMEDRYRAMSRLGVRNIEGYNQRLKEAVAKGETLTRQVQTGFDMDTGEPMYETQDLDTASLPYIVVVVDEMADLMTVAGKEIEAAVQRLAQMARAAGIHLIMATQRPSVDVITGTIKANFPTRISFQVASKFDSRTILGEQGSEQLLGRGDMLYMEPGGKIQRVHGPFVSDEEVLDVVQFLKSQGRPNYVESITDDTGDATLGVYGEADESKGDQLYKQAIEIVMREGKASTSFVQRHLQIGYNRAARIIEQMEAEGIISSANHVGKREVLRRAS